MDSGKLRKRIYEIIEVADPDDKVSQLYDIFMIVMIVLSLIPLAFKQENILLYTMDAVAVTVFIIDYVLRFATADYKLKDHSAKAFIRYPFTAMAIIDLVSILPSLIPLNSGLRALRVIRLIRSLRVFRALRMFRYSKNFRIIANVLRESRHAMYAVCTLAIGYIFISALIMFNVEPDLFDTFLDAVYWATITLATVGYGDIVPVTATGKVITILSAFVGFAIVALPAGVITAGYMTEVQKEDKQDQDIADV